MTKKKTGRVIIVSQEDNLLLKRFFCDCEEEGCTKLKGEICNDIFSLGLHEAIKNITKIS